MELPDLSNMSTYEQVKVACTYILETDNKHDKDHTHSSADLFDMVKHKFPESFSKEFSKNTFYQYLSNTVKDADSLINCLGRRKGYYLSSVAKEAQDKPDLSLSNEQSEATTETVSDTTTSQSQRRVQKEILLYPVLKSWLAAQGYQAEDISLGRSLGKWGNPDVAGINALDAFNGLSVELVTIEAKISLDNWEQWIFEAISHRRFANRAYFAFAHPEETISKIPQDMRYYAELYGIGVIALSMENEKYKQLQSGDLEVQLDSEDVEVVEVFSAPYSFVQPKYQLKFCNALGITCLKELYLWGRVKK